LITETALLRKSSVGAHYRSDCPGKSEGWDTHIIVSKTEGLRYESL
jgi:aspartate oxidase